MLKPSSNGGFIFCGWRGNGSLRRLKMSNTIPIDFADQESKELSEKFDKTFKGLACRICGNRDFGLLKDNDDTQMKLKSYKSNGESVFYNVTSFACTDCGHIEQFFDRILHKKIGKELSYV
jgi:transposase